MFVGRVRSSPRIWRPLYYGSSLTVRTILLGGGSAIIAATEKTALSFTDSYSSELDWMVRQGRFLSQSAVQRRRQVLRQRKEGKQKEIEAERKGKATPALDPERLGQFFDAVVPNLVLDQVEDLLSNLNDAMVGVGTEKSETGEVDAPVALTNILKLWSANKKKRTPDRFQGLLYDLIQPSPSRQRKSTLRIKSTINMERLIDSLIEARSRAIVDGMGWDTYMKFAVQPAEDASAVRDAASKLASHLVKYLPNGSVKGLQRLCDHYVSGGDPMPRLNVRIEQVTMGQYHFVAQELARFFPCPDADVAPTLTNYKRSWRRWNTLRESFITIATRAHEIMQMPAKPEKTPEYPGINVDDPERSFAVPKTRKKKVKHLKFEVISLTDLTVKSQVNGILSRTVLVDNLPITIDYEQLRKIYSRCGPLESMEIFQRRPDLDPGPQTLDAKAKRRREQIHKLGGNGWKRPRTPVYALLTFADKTGYERAIIKSLRLFGMLIERHPVRSIPGTSLTTLFIDDFELKAKALEQGLGAKLSNHWTVCLQAGQSNVGTVNSCEIQFPSFESAYEARQLLADHYNIHWLRTPENATDWWSRQLGFD